MNRLSVIIVAKNEEQWLNDCLQSISWADEIIVVDDGSTDHTKNIALRYTNNIFEYANNYSDFGSQKQFALSKATGEWVLSLDADERVTSELAQEIKKLIQMPNDVSVYTIPYHNYFLGHPLKMRCEQYSQPRLFRRTGSVFKNKIHEVIEVPGVTGAAFGFIDHYSYKSIASIVTKFNKYTDIEAHNLYQQGYRTNALKIFLAPFETFFRRQIILGGWRDSTYGLILNILFAYYYLLIQMKVWELAR